MVITALKSAAPVKNVNLNGIRFAIVCLWVLGFFVFPGAQDRSFNSAGTSRAPSTPALLSTYVPSPIPTVFPFALIAPRWDEYKDQIIDKNVDEWYGWVSNIGVESGQTEISIDLNTPAEMRSLAEVVFLLGSNKAEGMAVGSRVRFSGIVSKAYKDPLVGISLRLDNVDVVIVTTAKPPTAIRTSPPTATLLPTDLATYTASPLQALPTIASTLPSTAAATVPAATKTKAPAPTNTVQLAPSNTLVPTVTITPQPVPSETPQPVPSQTPQPVPTDTPMPPAPPPVSSGGFCPDMGATCPALTCEQALACLQAGNRRLDRDNDGKPCETQCGG